MEFDISNCYSRVDIDEIVGGDVEAADEPLPTYDPRPLPEQVAKSLAVAFAIGLDFSFLARSPLRRTARPVDP
jgi:hypothetical protein